MRVLAGLFLRFPKGHRVAVLLVGLFVAASNAEAKTSVIREYARPPFSIINILEKVIPELGCKITTLDRNNNTVTFVTASKRDMAIQIVSKGKETCSVEITGSAWFSNEPEEVAAKVHAKISDVLIKREAQKIATAQKAQPKVFPVQEETKPGLDNTPPMVKQPVSKETPEAKLVITKSVAKVVPVSDDLGSVTGYPMYFTVQINGVIKNVGDKDAKDILIGTECASCSTKMNADAKWFQTGKTCSIDYLSSGDKEDFEVIGPMVCCPICSTVGRYPHTTPTVKPIIVNFR